MSPVPARLSFLFVLFCGLLFRVRGTLSIAPSIREKDWENQRRTGEEATWEHVKAACLPVLPQSTAKIAQDWDWDWRRESPKTEDLADYYWNRRQPLDYVGHLSSSRESVRTHPLISNDSLAWEELYEAVKGPGESDGVPRNTVASRKQYIGGAKRAGREERGKEDINSVTLSINYNSCSGELCWIRGSISPTWASPSAHETFADLETSPAPDDKFTSFRSPISPVAVEASTEGQAESPTYEAHWTSWNFRETTSVHGFLVRGARNTIITSSIEKAPIPKLEHARVCLVSTGEERSLPHLTETRKAVRLLLSLRPDATDPLSLVEPHDRTPSLGFGVIQGVTMSLDVLSCCNASAERMGGDAAHKVNKVHVAEVDEGAGQLWVTLTRGPYENSGGRVHLLTMLPLVPEVKKWAPAEEEDDCWGTRSLKVLQKVFGWRYPILVEYRQMITTGFWNFETERLLMLGEGRSSQGLGEVYLLSHTAIEENCIRVPRGWLRNTDLWLQTGELQMKDGATRWFTWHCSKDVPQTGKGSEAVLVVINLVKSEGVIPKREDAKRSTPWELPAGTPVRDWVKIAAHGVYDPSIGLMTLAGCWGLQGNETGDGRRDSASLGEGDKGNEFGFPKCGVAVSIQLPMLWPAEIEQSVRKSQVVVRIWGLNLSNSDSSLGNSRKVITIRGPMYATELDLLSNRVMLERLNVLSVVLWTFTCFLYLHQIRYTKKYPSKGSKISSLTLAHLALGAAAPTLALILGYLPPFPVALGEYSGMTSLFSMLPFSKSKGRLWARSSMYIPFYLMISDLELNMSLVEVFLVWRLINAVMVARKQERRRERGEGVGTRTELQELLLARDKEERESGIDEDGCARGDRVSSRVEAPSVADVEEFIHVKRHGDSRAEETHGGDVEQSSLPRDENRKPRVILDAGCCPGARLLNEISLQLLFLPLFYISWLVCTIAWPTHAPFASQLRSLGKGYFLLPQMLTWAEAHEKECLNGLFASGMTVAYTLEWLKKGPLTPFSSPVHAVTLLFVEGLMRSV